MRVRVSGSGSGSVSVSVSVKLRLRGEVSRNQVERSMMVVEHVPDEWNGLAGSYL